MNGKTQQFGTSLLLSHGARRQQRVVGLLGSGFLLAVTSLSTFAVLFIFYFITRDALPFFQLQGFKQFFTSTHWYPSSATPEFGITTASKPRAAAPRPAADTNS